MASWVRSAGELRALAIIAIVTVLLQAVGLALSNLVSRFSTGSVASGASIAQLVMLRVRYAVATDSALMRIA